LREASPVEWLPLGVTVLYTCRIGQANCVQGIGHGCTVVISSADSDVELFEPVQTLEEVGCGGGGWSDEENEKSKTRDPTGSWHGLGTGRGLEGWERPLLCPHHLIAAQPNGIVGDCRTGLSILGQNPGRASRLS